MLQSKIKLTAPFGVAKQKEQSAGTDRVDELIMKVNADLKQAAKLHMEAVLAIKEIHDQKLYLKYAPTFAEFCEWKLNVSKSLVYRKLHQLAISEATGEEIKCPQLETSPLIESDLQQAPPVLPQLACNKPAVFPGSQLPQPEPKKPFKNKRMKQESKPIIQAAEMLNETLPQAPVSHFHETSTVDQTLAPRSHYHATSTVDHLPGSCASYPPVILDEIAQWRLEINRRITEQQDNPGFRKALIEWLDESGV